MGPGDMSAVNIALDGHRGQGTDGLVFTFRCALPLGPAPFPGRAASLCPSLRATRGLGTDRGHPRTAEGWRWGTGVWGGEGGSQPDFGAASLLLGHSGPGLPPPCGPTCKVAFDKSRGGSCHAGPVPLRSAESVCALLGVRAREASPGA